MADQTQAPTIPAGREYLRDTEVAARYGISKPTVWRWVREGILPAPVSLGPRCSRWKLSDLLAWEAEAEEVRDA